jgi:hypothetical protein
MLDCTPSLKRKRSPKAFDSRACKLQYREREKEKERETPSHNLHHHQFAHLLTSATMSSPLTPVILLFIVSLFQLGNCEYRLTRDDQDRMPSGRRLDDGSRMFILSSIAAVQNDINGNRHTMDQGRRTERWTQNWGNFLNRHRRDLEGKEEEVKGRTSVSI